MDESAKRAAIGDLIRTERTRVGLSQRALAKLLRLSPGAIAQWETGTTRPSFSNFIDACAIFGISVRGFIGDGGPYQGRFVDDPDTLAVVDLFESLQPTERPFLLRMLRNARGGIVIEGDKPKNPRKSA